MILSFTCNGLTRRLQRVENAVVAVRQDSNVDTVRMIFRPEEFNNISLATVSVKFLYVDTDGEIKAYQTGTTPDGGVYVADWELTDDVVDDAGYINFAVKLAVVNGDTVEKQWFSIPDTFRVYDSVDDTNNPPGETAAEQVTNAEKIAQLQSQLGTATSDLSSLTSTVALQGAALDAVNGRFCVTGNVTGETVQEFIANAVPLLNVPSDLKTATFSAVWANHGYVSGFIRKLRAAGGYNGMFKISSGDSASASEEYTFYSWDGVTFYANKMPTRAEMDALNSNRFHYDIPANSSMDINFSGYEYGSCFLIASNVAMYIVSKFSTIQLPLAIKDDTSLSFTANGTTLTVSTGGARFLNFIRIR